MLEVIILEVTHTPRNNNSDSREDYGCTKICKHYIGLLALSSHHKDQMIEFALQYTVLLMTINFG